MLFFASFAFGQSKDRRSIFIISIRFSTTTFVSVPCESFATQFEKRINTNEVWSADSIKMLDQFIQHIKFSRKEVTLDTRAKISYRNEFGKEIDICMDGANILVNERLVKRNKSFENFLFSLIPKEQFINTRIIR